MPHHAPHHTHLALSCSVRGHTASGARGRLPHAHGPLRPIDGIDVVQLMRVGMYEHAERVCAHLRARMHAGVCTCASAHVRGPCWHQQQQRGPPPAPLLRSSPGRRATGSDACACPWTRGARRAGPARTSPVDASTVYQRFVGLGLGLGLGLELWRQERMRRSWACRHFATLFPVSRLEGTGPRASGRDAGAAPGT